MNLDDLDFFREKLTIIGVMYNREVSDHFIEIYWDVLKGYEITDVSSAFASHMKDADSGQYFPKPSDIVRLIEGSGETKALKAWAKVDRAMRQVGTYPSVAFDDPIIHAVVSDMGGWHPLCMTNLEEIPYKNNEFRKRYMGYVNKPPEKYPRYFIGIHEAHNSAYGFPVEPPILIGEDWKPKYMQITSSETKQIGF